MTFKSKLFSGIAAGVFALSVGGAPAFAASTATDAFATNVRQNLTILMRSSEMAETQSTNEAIKTFAKDDIGAEDSFVAQVSPTDTPAIVASNMTGGEVDANGAAIGRSAAADVVVDPTVYAAPLGGGVTLQSGSWSLPYLETTTGKGFDWTYKAVQEDALTRLIGFYSAYGVSGDDPTMRAMALRVLPMVKARLVELRSL